MTASVYISIVVALYNVHCIYISTITHTHTYMYLIYYSAHIFLLPKHSTSLGNISITVFIYMYISLNTF